jgi:hypothetical protein
MNTASTSDCRAFLQRTGWFDASWYLERNPSAQDSELDPLEHYLAYGIPAGIGPNGAIDGLRTAVAAAGTGQRGAAPPGPVEHDTPQLHSEIDLLAASGLFDADYYLEHNPDVAHVHIDPLRHFCEYGWRDLRKPNRDFDVWWYWMTYLDPAREAINPLLHYALIGQRAGFAGRPAAYAPRPGLGYPLVARIRRMFLFAG